MEDFKVDQTRLNEDLARKGAEAERVVCMLRLSIDYRRYFYGPVECCFQTSSRTLVIYDHGLTAQQLKLHEKRRERVEFLLGRIIGVPPNGLKLVRTLAAQNNSNGRPNSKTPILVNY